MDTLKAWIAQGSQWVADNPTTVVYAALVLAGLTIVRPGGRR